MDSLETTTNSPTIDLLEDETLSQKLVKKGFWLYFFSFLIGPAGYLIRLMISNSGAISVADVGILYSIISLVGFLNVYNDLGLTESLQYFLPRYRVKKEYNNIKTSIVFSFLAQFITAIVIAIVLWFGADWLAIHYFHSDVAVQILKYFCIYFLGINLFQTLQTIFIAFQKTFDQQFVGFVQMRSIVAFTALFFFSGKQSIEWYSLSWIIGLFFGIVTALFLYKKKYHKSLRQGKIAYHKESAQEYGKYALWAFLGMNVGVVFTQLIQQLVILMLGAEQAGYYTNFLSLFNISTIIIGPIMGLIFPMVSEIITKKQDDKLKLLFHFFYTYFSVLTLSVAIFLIILGPEIAVTLFSEKFLFSGKLLTAGGIFSVFITLTNFNFSVLAGMGEIKERVKMLAIATVFLIFSAIIGMFFLGTYGAVLSFGIAYFLLGALSLIYLAKRVALRIDWKFVIKNIIILFSLGVIVWLFKGNIFLLHDSERWVNVGKIIFIGLFFYTIFVGFNYREVKVLRGEVRKLRG